MTPLTAEEKSRIRRHIASRKAIARDHGVDAFDDTIDEENLLDAYEALERDEDANNRAGQELVDERRRLLDRIEALEHYEVEYRSASRVLDELGIGVGSGFPLSRRIAELARSRGREGA